jgi:hypothetical protein
MGVVIKLVSIVLYRVPRKARKVRPMATARSQKGMVEQRPRHDRGKSDALDKS